MERPQGATGSLVGRATTSIGNPAQLIAYTDAPGMEPSVWRLYIDAPGGHTVNIETGHGNVAIQTAPPFVMPAIGTVVIPDIIGSTVTATITGATAGQVCRAILVRVRL